MMNMINPYDVDSRFDIALSEISSVPIEQFHRHWLRLFRGSSLPSRADVDPSNFKRLLPNIILAEIEHDPFRVRYRLCGTRVAEFCGNLTGRYLDEMGGAELWSAAAYLRLYQIAASDGRPVFSVDSMRGEFGARYHFQAGIWPLSGDGRAVDMCIAVEDYHNQRRADMAPGTTLPAF
jgi:hypothetical protein